MDKLPTYKITLKPDGKSGVYAVSLVDQPAIEVDWIKLSKEIIDLQFAVNSDKQMLYGPILIPDKKIPRFDEATGTAYNIVFTADVIEEIVLRYNKNKINDIFNINHSGVAVDAYLAENWLVRRPDASESYGYDLPEGTWFGGVKVEDSKFWMSEIKSENVKGFSVEIQCGIELMEFNKLSSKAEDEYNNQNTIKLMKYATKDGVVLEVKDGEMVEGSVLVTSEEFNPAGDHVLEDGTKITVDENGVVTKIEKVEEMSTETEAVTETETEPTKLALDPAEVMAAIQPALDEFRTILAEMATRLDVLEQHEAEMPEVSPEYSVQIEELKSQVEKLASAAGATSITTKNDRNDARTKNEERLLSKINFFSKL